MGRRRSLGICGAGRRALSGMPSWQGLLQAAANAVGGRTEDDFLPLRGVCAQLEGRLGQHGNKTSKVQNLQNLGVTSRNTSKRYDVFGEGHVVKVHARTRRTQCTLSDESIQRAGIYLRLFRKEK